jgi:hypothetical protein
MGKTFYSVVFKGWGADSAETAWFDDKVAADAFADHDYRDNVIVHHVSNPDTIARYEGYVEKSI